MSIKCLRFDGGGKYFSNEFSEYLKEHGIQKKYSCSYSPQQNGVVERKNKHIVEVARAMLNEKNLPNYFWVEAIAIGVYIMNRTPTTGIHGMTLEKKFTGKKPDVSHLRVFDCIAYVAPLLSPSVGVKPNTWKSRESESSGTPECSELDRKAQNTSP